MAGPSIRAGREALCAGPFYVERVDSRARRRDQGSRRAGGGQRRIARLSSLARRARTPCRPKRTYRWPGNGGAQGRMGRSVPPYAARETGRTERGASTRQSPSRPSAFGSLMSAINPTTHTRLPRYARGNFDVIERDDGALGRRGNPKDT